MGEKKYLVIKRSNSKFLCKTRKDRLKWKKDGFYLNHLKTRYFNAEMKDD